MAYFLIKGNRLYGKKVNLYLSIYRRSWIPWEWYLFPSRLCLQQLFFRLFQLLLPQLLIFLQTLVQLKDKKTVDSLYCWHAWGTEISAVRLMERFIVKEVDINLNSELRCRTIEATSLWAVKQSIFKTFEQKLINYGKLYKPLLMNKLTEERSKPISRIDTNFIVVCT